MVSFSLEVIDLLTHHFTPGRVVNAVDRCGFQAREGEALGLPSPLRQGPPLGGPPSQ